MTSRFSQNFWTQRSSALQTCAPPPPKLALAGDAALLAGAGFHEAACGMVRRVRGAETPAAVFVPEHYEPNYAYPLIVWLHAAGGSERELSWLMPRISTRNYVGVAFRGTVGAGGHSGRYRWPTDDEPLGDLIEAVGATLRGLRREFHIHSERIFVAGFAEGATMALRLALGRPEWFGGAIALSGRFPRSHKPLVRFRDLQHKRVLIGAGARDRRIPVAEAVRAGRLLHAAGMGVTTRVYEAGHELTPMMLAHVNEWMMDGVCAGV